MSERYPSDPAIISHIMDRIAQIRPQAIPERRDTPPSREQVERMISVAFAASLESEEGRPVRFTLTLTGELNDYVRNDGYRPPDSINLPAIQRTLSVNYKFKEDRPLSASALVRLSVALDPTKTCVAVAERSGQLTVIGTWHGYIKGLFDIRVVAAGVFVVSYAGFLVLTYRRGQAVLHTGTYEIVNDVGTLLAQPPAGYPDEARESHALQCRFRIAKEMLRLGHGGTVLIVPHNMSWEQVASTQKFEPIEPQHLVLEWDEAHYNMWVERWTLSDHLPDAVDALARLTATDGMVLIRPDLAILGFGVFFEAQDLLPDDSVEVRDPYEDDSFQITSLQELGGARHQSAAFAALRLPGSLALVASSDGTLTAMRRTDAASPLIVHKHLELRLPEPGKYT